MSSLLKIQDLHSTVKNKAILKGLNLEINYGEVHAIMGPNGSGKSTLSKVLAGHPDYEVTSGSILYEINGRMKNLVPLEPDMRAKEGVFLAYQYPVEVPGVSNSEFLRASLNSVLAHQGSEELDPMDFQEFLKGKLDLLGMDNRFANRQVNVDFSGGEKKRNEILQMAVLSPRLAILDETDSGLDVDALKQVALGVNKLKSQDNAILLITHYQRLLDFIVPDFVHILFEGKIIKSGTKELAMEIERRGYEFILSGATS